MPIPLNRYFGICYLVENTPRVRHKQDKAENTRSCVVSGCEMMGVNSVDYFLHNRQCSLNTPANVFSLHTFVS